MEKSKTFNQMLEAYKAIRKQIMDAKLDDITSVAVTEYNRTTTQKNWITIEVNIGVGDDFVANQCRYIRIANYNFDKGMADFKEFIAERINQPNN